jgi:hypothetical protein
MTAQEYSDYISSATFRCPICDQSIQIGICEHLREGSANWEREKATYHRGAMDMNESWCSNVRILMITIGVIAGAIFFLDLGDALEKFGELGKMDLSIARDWPPLARDLDGATVSGIVFGLCVLGFYLFRNRVKN